MLRRQSARAGGLNWSGAPWFAKAAPSRSARPADSPGMPAAVCL
jgi:hypothetical protein